MNKRFAIFATIVLLAGQRPATAEILKLRDGSILLGKIKSESTAEIVIQTDKGHRVIERSTVQQVIYDSAETQSDEVDRSPTASPSAPRLIGLPEGFTPWSIQFYGGNGRFSTKVQNAHLDLMSLVLLGSSTGTASSTTTPVSTYLPLLLVLAGDSNATVTGSAPTLDFKAEYRPKYLGFQFGLSSTNLKFIPESPTLLSWMIVANSGSSASALNFLLLSDLLSPKPFGAAVTTFDFAFTVHALPHQILNPYLGIGIGAGQCGVDCGVGKAFAKLGMRLNFSGGYVFVEGEAASYRLRNEKNVREKPKPTDGKRGFLGFGLYI